MVGDHPQSSLNLGRLEEAKAYGEYLGKLAPVPRYQYIPSLLHKSPERSFYVNIHETVNNLGRAIQLGQHRHLIDRLNNSLNHSTLTAMVRLAWSNSEVCAALAVYLTTLEQAYHWPREQPVATPAALEDHKLVIQMLNQPQLREILQESISPHGFLNEAITAEEITRTALRSARLILDVAQFVQKKNLSLPRRFQDTVNLLYRTCRSDWGDQGDYDDVFSHREFGRLHEVVRASGTQRRMQDLFEKSDGLSSLQTIPNLLASPPAVTNTLSDVLTQLQFAVAIVREELFGVCVDEVIWGRVFANFSKAVGFSDISAGGGDAPIFWMLDSLCGQVDPEQNAMLPEELNFRARFFPPNIRALFNGMKGSPSLRTYCKSPHATEDLKQSFTALERQRYELYEMHRKKAARIVLSLRAGQRGTSAGSTGCPYATPEKHLAKTLSTAMAARFGVDNRDTLINATARSHSLMFDKHGNVYSARVRFDFGTPLTIGPGDCLLVDVQLPDGVRQTRTFSVTYTYATRQPLEQDAHQICGTAEVYIRRKGLVSAYLCSQTQGCEVRVAVKPASHFRLVANSNSTKTTVFVAQGGALGIFLAWLEAQKQLTGHYVLVVASRQFSQLGFKDELLKIADQLKQNLKIVLVLSKSDEREPFDLQKTNIQVYHGRVNQYFTRNRHSEAKAFYVCGTSSFGLNVARSISPAQSNTDSNNKYPNRLAPIITSHLPPIRLHVAPEPQTAHLGLPIISRAELAQHNSPTDLWIAIGDRVYDITSLSSFHPGGEKILLTRAGRQAQDLFESVHGGSVDIESMLHNMMVGHLAPVNPARVLSIWEGRLDRIVEMQNDLTNHSRFENLAEDKNHNTSSGSDSNSTTQQPDLSLTPPTHVIYATIDCFSRDWSTLIQSLNLPTVQAQTKQCQLMRASVGLKKTLDARQAAVYHEKFDNVEECRRVVRFVFDSLRTVAEGIHAALDDIKAEIKVAVEGGVEIADERLVVCTDRVVKVVQDQLRLVAG